ncbi:MAG: zinc ribbon domain-containing protein [Gemmatimonadetes bacterium]|nr:zinc ribbon domain-containing protein [Gemmatimonadota bacterium]
MMIFEALLAVLVGGAALSLILLPLFRPMPAAAEAGWDLPDLEETRKGQALIALKEIEFDLATGKLSDNDFADLKRKFTAEAVAAMREDQGGAVAVAPKPGVKGGGLACPTCGPRPESDAIFCSTCGRLLSTLTCAGCGSAMAPGAKFCESCGRPAAR